MTSTLEWFFVAYNYNIFYEQNITLRIVTWSTMGQQTMQANKPVFLLMFKMILGFSYFLFIYLSILQKAIFPQNTII